MQNAIQPAARVQPGPSGLGTAVKVGAITGQIAGLVMAVVVMLVFTLFLGKGPLYPVQVIGSFGLGDAALHGLHWGAILLGLVLHQLGPSLFWGVVFGLIVERRHGLAGTSPWLLGLVIGLLSQVIDVELVLRWAMPALHGHNIWAEQVPAFWSWAAHAVFGLALGVYPSVRKKLA